MNEANEIAAKADAPQPDAASGNWVDLYAPADLRPYLRLIRADRPIGVWLLLWPCWWATALAAQDFRTGLKHLILFALGAFFMRSAGCVFNDIIDRELDAKVERTKNRPVACGAISVPMAVAIMIALSLAGFIVLLQFNGMTILLGIGSLGLVAAYPFMKRITDWPQAWLGLAFNWGAILGWTAIGGRAPDLMGALALYVGSIFWTLAYDTIYAHQDKEDDALIGVRSTARLFGDATVKWLTFFFIACFAGLAIAGGIAQAGKLYFVGLLFAGLHAAGQLRRLDIDDPDCCLREFKSNVWIGAIVFAGALAGHLY